MDDAATITLIHDGAAALQHASLTALQAELQLFEKVTGTLSRLPRPLGFLVPYSLLS